MEDITFVQEAIKRIHSHKGVRGSIIVSSDGIPLRCVRRHNPVIVSYKQSYLVLADSSQLFQPRSNMQDKS